MSYTQTETRDYSKTYWTGKGEEQETSMKLHELLNTMDLSTYPKMIRLRSIQQAYYDLYNNGGYNLGKEISKYFGSGVRAFNKNYPSPSEVAIANEFIIRADQVLTKAIREAAKEVGL